MKITRYPQSCLLIEKNGRKIIIDPGDDFAASFSVDQFGEVEGVLYTHQHGDHYEEALCKEFISKGIKIYGNASVAELIGSEAIKIDDGQKFDLAGFNIQAIDLPHCPLPDGSAGPQNTGFLIDGSFFDPGDGIKLEGLKVEILADPIIGPDISFRDACDFAKQLEAKKVIPIHYDKLGAKPEVFQSFAEGFAMPFEVIVLGIGESTEI